jgi:hypothetical protein
MVEQTDLVEADYLNDLYKDLYIKAAMDINATIAIISWMEDISLDTSTIDPSDVFSKVLHLPGKPPMELVTEFKGFWATSSKRPSLDKILDLRNSLYRFQSLT